MVKPPEFNNAQVSPRVGSQGGVIEHPYGWFPEKDVKEIGDRHGTLGIKVQDVKHPPSRRITVNSDHLNKRVKVLAIGAAAIAASAGGLTACNPPPNALACTTIVSVGKNLTGTVTTKTVAGAKVLTVANYHPAAVARLSNTDSHGLTSATFDLRKTTKGDTIDVAVQAVKGKSQGVCRAKFVRTTGNTENNQPGSSKPLTAAISVSWLLPEDTGNLPFNSSSPAASCFPSSGHIRTGEGCGTVFVNTVVKGFSGYGNTPVCADGTTTCQEPYAKEAYLSGKLNLAWSVKCLATGVITNGSKVTELGPAWQSSAQYVSPYTATSKDAAKLRIAADLPLGDSLAACDGPSSLESVTASAAALKLNHRATAYPESSFTAAGPFRP